MIRSAPKRSVLRRRALVACLALLCVSASAWAQLRTRRVGVQWREGVPHVSVGLRDLVNDRVQEELQGGLRKRIVVTAQAYRVGNSRPLATRKFSCGVTFDLWEQTYLVRVGREVERYSEFEEVVQRCLMIHGLPVGRASDYANVHGRDIFFAVRAEFDPIDERRCRELLRSSSGMGDPIGPIVVNIVRRDICQADRAVEFRSPEQTCP